MSNSTAPAHIHYADKLPEDRDAIDGFPWKQGAPVRALVDPAPDTLTAVLPVLGGIVSTPRSWWWPRIASRQPGVDVGAAITKAELDVHLVLGDDRPLPSSQADVDELLTRLAGHLEILARVGATGSKSGAKAAGERRLSGVSGSAGPMESRIRLVMAAESVQELLAHVRAESASPSAAAQPRRRRHWQMFGRRLPLPPALARRARDLEEVHV